METSKNTLSRLMHRRRMRGAASVEAVVVLPVFVILLVSLLYVRDQAIAKQAADNQARTCAWLYSANNCSEVPPGCEGVLTEHTPTDRASPLVTEALKDGTGSIASSAVGSLVASVIDTLLGPAIDAAFGRAVDAQTEKEVPRPPMYGDEPKKISGRYRLACNLSHTTPEQVALDAWEVFKP